METPYRQWLWEKTGTQCVESLKKHGCNAPQCICRITTILHRRPMTTEVAVVLVNEALGF